MTNQEKSSTAYCMIGSWLMDELDTKIEISIDLHNVKIIHIGKTQIVVNNPHWFGENHLCFPETYYVRFADAKKMIFGKFKHELLGVCEWEYCLFRVKRNL
jgi:hypothetical protein